MLEVVDQHRFWFLLWYSIIFCRFASIRCDDY